MTYASGARSRAPRRHRSADRTPSRLFEDVKRALPAPRSLCERWLPDGKIQGQEYVARNPTRADRKPGSFKINLSSGKWADFATGEAGGDMISLYAYLHGLRQIEAARELAQEMGVR